MRHGFWALWLLLLAPLAVTAQQATVLSGEHNGFTRLVAPIPNGGRWTISQIGREVSFIVPEFDRGFDISEVYRLIPRDRVQDITPQPDGFVLSLGCDCRVAPFVSQDRFVVLDITSPGVPGSVPFVEKENPIELSSNETNNTARQGLNSAVPIEIDQSIARLTDVASERPNLLGITANDSPRVDLPLLTSQRPGVIQPLDLPALARAPLPENEQDVLEEVQERLVRELGSAATQGILNPIPGVSLPSLKRPQIDLSTITLPEEEPTPQPMPEAIAGMVNNMRISSSMDLPSSARPNANSQSLSGLSCPRNADVDLANWANDRPFHEQTGDYRRALYAEFDRLDEKAALSLAKIYLHYGFGAEAQQILRLSDDLAQKNTLLINIAEIMENGVASSGSSLPSMLDCETDIALWAILAREDLDVPQSIDPRPALLALNKLPVHLRTFLAPALSARLLSHGNNDAAATALRNLERRPAELPTAARLAQANIALDEDEIEKGKEALIEVISDNAEESPEALIKLIETKLNADQPIDAKTASLVEAYAKELQGDELGPALRNAHVLALVKSGQFDRAFDATSELGGDAEDDASINLRLRLVAELTAAASDVVFLEHIFEQSPTDVERLPVKQKVALAGRLLELGFAQQAQTVIESVPARPRNEERQLLAAQIALELNQPDIVLSSLAEMNSEEAYLMRAQASQMAGSHEEAHALFQAAEDFEGAAQAAWLAENWQTLTTEQDSVFNPIADLSTAELSASTDTNGMLARSAQALDESAAARQTLVDMLSAPEFEISAGSGSPEN